MKLSKKAEQLVETSKTLFYKFGIKRISVEEICKTANVSKMTFYKYFDNKDAMVEYLADELFNEGYLKFQEIFSKDITLEEKFKEWIEMKMSYSRSMSKEFYLDLIHYNKSIHSRIGEKSKQLQDETMQQLTEAKEKNEVSAEISNEFIAYMLNHFVSIVDDPAFSSLYGNLEDMTRDIAQFFLYGMFGGKSNNE